MEDFPELLRRAQGSDEVAFNTLFRDVQPVLLRYLATMAGPDLVEDIAAETWVAVIRGLDRFVADDIRAFRGWVLAIARRRWVDDIRRKARRPEVLAADTPEVGTDDDPAGLVEQKMSTERAMALIRTLPPDQAEVVLLRVIGDLDVPATAQIVGKSEGAVRVLAHRGLKKLAAILEPGVTNPAPGAVDQ